MDRFRIDLDDPDAPRLAAAVLWDEVGPAYTMETFIRGAAAVLDHIELDAIEQPRLPTRSEVKARFSRVAAYWSDRQVAEIMVREGWATEDPEPEVDPADVKALAQLIYRVDGYDNRERAERRARRLLASGRVQVTPQ